MDSITVYSFDRFSGAFTGPIEAFQSPLEEGVYLDPAFSCREPPPEYEAGTIPVRVDDSWIIMPDRRGEVWFDHNGNEVVVDAVGDPIEQGLLANRPKIETPEVLRTSLFKTEIYERMNDDELEAFDDAMSSAGTRSRLMWRDCLAIEASSPFFETLKEQMTAAFGAKRAETILSLKT